MRIFLVARHAHRFRLTSPTPRRHEAPGGDFLANFRRTLQPALDGVVNLVVHRGNLLFRSRATLAFAAEPSSSGDVKSPIESVPCSLDTFHRAPILKRDFAGARLRDPVIYPDSAECISWTERDEEKQFAILTIDETPSGASRTTEREWIPLPGRPMGDIVLNSTSPTSALESQLRRRLSSIHRDAVVHVLLDVP